MSFWELQVVERRRVHRRQNNNNNNNNNNGNGNDNENDDNNDNNDNNGNNGNNQSPCPNGDGTTIGTAQQFTVLCDMTIGGDVLNRVDAFDFTTCVDICSSFHPKCEGVTFNGTRCTLKAGGKSADQRRSRRNESAVAKFPGASSNCVTLGGSQRALGTNFTTMCGFVINGSDIGQNFAPTFQDCLGQCAATRGCAAVSFDPSQNLGFKNCYLKNTVSNPNSIGADRRTDSALVAAAAAPAPPGDSSTSAAPEPSAVIATPAPSPTNPGVSVIPVSSPAPADGGAVFFTPPDAGTAVVPSPPASSTLISAPDSAAPTAIDMATTLSSLPATGSLPFTFPGPNTTPAVSSTTAVPEAAGQDTGDAPSMAWVAAPVVGSVAAIALIAVSFVLLRRRRRGNGGKRPTISRPSPLSSLLTAWLPASWSSPARDESRASGRKMTGMGNFSEVESGRQSADVRGSVRGSMVGFVTGRPAGMERLEDIEEGGARSDFKESTGQKRESPPVSGVQSDRPELRNSFNGLGQNKWAQ
ncbi:hypothetical protein C8A00DRAFT_17965 [Chaetomidium leptoderma]|uniref:Apple domain-containing protein n=1 Tax=Chaetomidium leptoderma TaxID=669021 RepID=A0AAN6VGR1_9PEZI|nr:hypothetical protein C8A00DRAFT_17965 [Chaetomidium leptoderma]